jgi:hypothetical protein
VIYKNSANSRAHVDSQKHRVSSRATAKTPTKSRATATVVDGPERPQLTHRILDNLAAQLELVERNTDVHDVAQFVGLAMPWIPRLIEAARQVIPGETLAEVYIPGFVPGGSLNSREHWQARSRRVKREHHIVTTALMAGAAWLRNNRGHTVGKVVITRLSAGKPDSDQVVGYVKGVRDATAKFLGVDDGSDVVTWVVESRRVKLEENGVVIRFERRIDQSAHPADPLVNGLANAVGIGSVRRAK